MVVCSVRGEASGVSLEEVTSCSSVAVMRAVSMPRAFIMSLKVGSDSSSNDKRSDGGWVLFLILAVSPFLVGFMHVFNLGAIVP